MLSISNSAKYSCLFRHDLACSGIPAEDLSLLSSSDFLSYNCNLLHCGRSQKGIAKLGVKRIRGPKGKLCQETFNLYEHSNLYVEHGLLLAILHHFTLLLGNYYNN